MPGRSVARLGLENTAATKVCSVRLGLGNLLPFALNFAPSVVSLPLRVWHCSQRTPSAASIRTRRRPLGAGQSTPRRPEPLSSPPKYLQERCFPR